MIAARFTKAFAEYENVSMNGGVSVELGTSAGSAVSTECMRIQSEASATTRKPSQLPSVRRDEPAMPRAKGAAAISTHANIRATTPDHASDGVSSRSAIDGASSNAIVDADATKKPRQRRRSNLRRSAAKRTPASSATSRPARPAP